MADIALHPPNNDPFHGIWVGIKQKFFFPTNKTKVMHYPYSFMFKLCRWRTIVTMYICHYSVLTTLYFPRVGSLYIVVLLEYNLQLLQKKLIGEILFWKLYYLIRVYWNFGFESKFNIHQNYLFAPQLYEYLCVIFIILLFIKILLSEINNFCNCLSVWYFG